MMVAMRVLLLLAALLGVASAAPSASFGSAPACGLATRPQMAGVALYGDAATVRSLLAAWSCLLCIRTSATKLQPTHLLTSRYTDLQPTCSSKLQLQYFMRRIFDV
jgi:hypothetical protein